MARVVLSWARPLPAQPSVARHEAGLVGTRGSPGLPGRTVRKREAREGNLVRGCRLSAIDHPAATESQVPRRDVGQVLASAGSDTNSPPVMASWVAGPLSTRTNSSAGTPKQASASWASSPSLCRALELGLFPGRAGLSACSPREGGRCASPPLPRARQRVAGGSEHKGARSSLQPQGGGRIAGHLLGVAMGMRPGGQPGGGRRPWDRGRSRKGRAHPTGADRMGGAWQPCSSRRASAPLLVEGPGCLPGASPPRLHDPHSCGARTTPAVTSKVERPGPTV